MVSVVYVPVNNLLRIAVGIVLENCSSLPLESYLATVFTFRFQAIFFGHCNKSLISGVFFNHIALSIVLKIPRGLDSCVWPSNHGNPSFSHFLNRAIGIMRK